MEVAISSPVNIDPPPLLFGHRPSTPSPSQSRSPRHSPQFSSRHYSPPPLPSPSFARPHTAAMDLDSTVTSPHPQGQNHDRIDAEMQDSGVPDTGSVPDPVATIVARADNPAADTEEMDTTPDETPRGAEETSGSAGRTSATEEPVPAGVSVVSVIPEPNGIATVEQTSTAPASRNDDLNRVTSNGSSIDSNIDMDIVPPATIELGPTSPRDSANADLATIPPPPPGVNSVPPPPPPVLPPDPEGEQDEYVADDEEDPWWTDFVEDNSTPEEEELKEIEQAGPEISAIDHNHWESTFWQELDDPEYIPAEAGRIDWTVNNVRGTRQEPNRETVLRSPPKCIGGFYWRLKLFPRGDQTSQLSVYVECSPEAWDDENEDQAIGGVGNVNVSADGTDKVRAAVGASDGSSDPEVRDPGSSAQNSPTSPKAGNQHPWEVAAQFGVVLYNPAEPRVQYNFTEQHQFWNGNDDFGRKRFHGPWDEIHVRQRGQRQALLRNDTLALSAYIRIVKDPTGSLWWSQRDEGPPWDNLAKTGLRGMSTRMEGEGFFTAGMAAWLHLAPFQDLVRDFHVPDQNEEPHARPKPLFAALQRILYLTFHQSPPATTVELSPIVEALKWYGIDFSNKIDTLEAWEILRWKMMQEAEGTDAQERLAQLFGHVASPGRMSADGSPRSQIKAEPSATSEYPCIRLPARYGGSVQESLAKVLGDTKTPASSIVRSAPELLQVELERQVFESTTRKWRKINNRVVLDEQLVFPKETVDRQSDLKYSLFAMVVHRGALQSGLYYLVIRPAGPRTKWFRFYGEREGYQVQCITRKQAIRAHEGFEEGERSEETAAVAYLVMYVRDDVFEDGSRGKPGIYGQVPRWLKKDVQGLVEEAGPDLTPTDNEAVASNEVEPEEEQFTFRIFHEDVSKNHQGHGYIDLYDSRWSSGQSYNVCHVTLAAQASLLDVLHEAVKRTRPEADADYFQLYVMDASMETVPNAPKLGITTLDTKLGVVRRVHPLRCLWLVHLPSPRASWGSPTPNDSDIINRSGVIDGTVSTDQTNPIPGDDVEDVEMDDHHDQVASPVLANHAAEGQNILDTADISGTVVEAALAADAVTDAPSTSTPVFTADSVYLFVRYYSTVTQCLTGLCAVIAQPKEKVAEAVKRTLDNTTSPIDISKSPWTVWKEVGLDDAKLIEMHNAIGDEGLNTGDRLILQIKPSKEETKSIEERGDFANPADYLRYLNLCSNHPTRVNGHITQSYFSSNYFSGTMKRGRAYGPCVTTDMNGNSYTGNFLASNRSGLGTMTFQNGDVYEGEWSAHQMHGQGKMVYAVTGNEYVGGFKKGKRFGKGTMHYLVADEEEIACQICYEGEQDALFYDCGHVCACVECARQVDVCPVCRKSVRAVVKIYRT